MKLITPQFWRKKTLLSILLYPLAILYNLISLYISYVPKQKIYQPKAKIIRVGNITLGGSGKTPVVISLAQFLSEKKIAILTRGYKGKLIGPIMLNEHHMIDEVGDEALLLFKHAPTCVAKDRLEGIKFLENSGFEIIITDDGMQDNRFIAALTIMVIDSYFGFGNGMIFPAGPLRESIDSGMNKSDAIVVIGNGEFKSEFTAIKASLETEISLHGKSYVAFAGIGNPEKFFFSAEAAGANLIKKLSFPDHHQYTEADMELLFSFASPLITTEKDFVRLEKRYQEKVETLPIKLVWKDNTMNKILLKITQ